MTWVMFAVVLLVQSPAAAAPPAFDDNYLMGKPDSTVRIEVYSDFQCPSCRAFYLNTVTRLITEYSAGGKVSLILREFPLSMHPVARPAARYALASRHLGQEPMLKVIEQLYTYQAEWSYGGKIEPVLARILSEDEMAKLNEKLKDPAIEQTIDHEVELGTRRKVTSTPTVFATLGGKEQTLVGGLSFQVFKEYIDRSLK